MEVKHVVAPLHTRLMVVPKMGRIIALMETHMSPISIEKEVLHIQKATVTIQLLRNLQTVAKE